MTSRSSLAEWTGELSALESRAEIDSLEDLHARRRALLAEFAPLRVLHGPADRFDYRRKNFLSAMKVRARMEMAKRGDKITEGAIDDFAHADEQYVKFVDQGIEDATRYVALQNEMDEINEKIRNRELALLAYHAECKLAR